MILMQQTGDDNKKKQNTKTQILPNQNLPH